MVKPGEL